MGTKDNASKNRKVAIIGAGASGLMAAITAAKLGAQVFLFEHNDRVGKKILQTGNGKCNLGHIGVCADDYYGSVTEYFDECIAFFGTDNTISFFEELGLYIRNKDGYLYPYSETATSVLDVLRFKVAELGINVFTETTIISIEWDSNRNEFDILTDHGKYNFHKVIICTGGLASPKSGSDGSGFELIKKLGHTTTTMFPALTKLKSSASFCNSIDGVRAKGLIRVIVDNQDTNITDSGEIQFTKDGISGIPVFNLSRIVSKLIALNKQIVITVNLIPDLNKDSLYNYYYSRINQIPNDPAENLFTGLVNKKIMYCAMKLAGISINDKVSSITSEKIKKYISSLSELGFNITGCYGYDNAQVTAGGIPSDEIFSTLESRKYKGLFFAGEILDIDGKCGGYNLQWAWTSGYIAAYNAMKDSGK